MRSYSPVETYEVLASVVTVDAVQIFFDDTEHWLVQFWKATSHRPNNNLNTGPYLTFENPNGEVIVGKEGDYVVRNGDDYSVYSSREFYKKFKIHKG